MLTFDPNGNLASGIHEMDIKTFKEEFGSNVHRSFLISGLEKATMAFRSFKVPFLYVDGSFVSKKRIPSDYDVCYEMPPKDLSKLFLFYPVFRTFRNNRRAQKEIFYGEFFPATFIAAPPKEMYLDFFQHDKDGNSKGVVKLFI
jgi:hypothetical protein